MNNLISISAIRWLAFSAAVPLVTLVTAAAYLSIPPDTRGVDLKAGGELFSVHCGSCHFANAGYPAHHGPNLHDIGKTGATRKPELSAAEYILESITDPSAFLAPSGRPGMPNNLVAELDPDEIRNIVGYLANCGASPDYDEIVDLEIPVRQKVDEEPVLIRRADMQLAEEVLRTKGACLQCHALDSVPEGAVFAPALFGVGLKDEQALRDSMLNPHREIKLRYKLLNVLLSDGQVVSGQLVSRSDERIVLCVRDRQNRLAMREIPLTEIEHNDGVPQIKESETSLMPSGFDKLLSEDEIKAVINLIRQLN